MMATGTPRGAPEGTSSTTYNPEGLMGSASSHLVLLLHQNQGWKQGSAVKGLPDVNEALVCTEHYTSGSISAEGQEFKVILTTYQV